MKCPVCKRATLAMKMVAESLSMACCTECGGKWLSSASYWSWLETLDREFPEKENPDFLCEIHDSSEAKVCPDCGRILIKYKVGRGIEFNLDHCNSCNGVWFDRNEWEILENANLHDEIHKIFTTSWQNEILLEEKKRYFDRMYQQKFGNDYLKINEFKTWLDAHEMKNSILAFLSDPKPYA